MAFAGWNELHQRGILDEPPTESNRVPGQYFEVNAACSGLVVALAHLYTHASYYHGKLVDLIATEGGYRKTLPPLEEDDGETGSLQRTLFTDGAAGIRGRYGIDFTIVKKPLIKLFCDAEKTLCIPMAPASPPSFTLEIPPPNGIFQRMKGNPVFKWTNRELPAAIRETIKGTNAKKVILHQANGRIIEMQQRLFPHLDFPNHIKDTGNTSSASILFALSEEIKRGTISKGEEVGLIGFGGGLMIAGAVVKFG